MSLSYSSLTNNHSILNTQSNSGAHINYLSNPVVNSTNLPPSQFHSTSIGGKSRKKHRKSKCKSKKHKKSKCKSKKHRKSNKNRKG